MLYYLRIQSSHESMSQQRKTRILTVLGVTDLVFFALGGLHYGKMWSGFGVLGLLLFLALFEFL